MQRNGSSGNPNRTLTAHVPLTFRKRGGRRLVLAPEGSAAVSRRARIDNSLIKALARAFRWQRLIETGTFATATEIAVAEKVNDSYVARVLRLTLLAPDIVEAILDGQNGCDLQLCHLLAPLPIGWQEQRQYLRR